MNVLCVLLGHRLVAEHDGNHYFCQRCRRFFSEDIKAGGWR